MRVHAKAIVRPPLPQSFSHHRMRKFGTPPRGVRRSSFRPPNWVTSTVFPFSWMQFVEHHCMEPSQVNVSREKLVHRIYDGVLEGSIRFIQSKQGEGRPEKLEGFDLLTEKIRSLLGEVCAFCILPQILEDEFQLKGALLPGLRVGAMNGGDEKRYPLADFYLVRFQRGPGPRGLFKGKVDLLAEIEVKVKRFGFGGARRQMRQRRRFVHEGCRLFFPIQRVKRWWEGAPYWQITSTQPQRIILFCKQELPENGRFDFPDKSFFLEMTYEEFHQKAHEMALEICSQLDGFQGLLPELRSRVG